MQQGGRNNGYSSEASLLSQRMQLCNCGELARRGFSDGRPTAYCGKSGSTKCKFGGFIFNVHGYERPPFGQRPIIDLEACNHPANGSESFTARLFSCDPQLAAALVATFRGDVLQGQAVTMPGTAEQRTIFPLERYSAFLNHVRDVHVGIQIAAIPDFFFRCYRSLKAQYETHRADEDGGLTQGVVAQDHVFQKLRPFQQRGVEYIVHHGGRGLIADAMGLGKTVQAIAIAHQYRSEWPVLVVCPVSLTFNWANEFMQWTDMPLTRIHTVAKQKSIPSTADVVLVSYTMLDQLEAIMAAGGQDNAANPFKVVVLDESHMIKSIDAKRSMLAIRLCEKSQRCVLLSGTPTPSRPFEMYNQLRAIHGEDFMKMDHFAARYCNVVRNRFAVDRTNNSYGAEINFLIRHSMIRRGKAEVEQELPPKMRIRHWLHLSPTAKQHLSRDVALLQKAVAEKGDGAFHFDNYLTMRYDTAKAKASAVQAYVRDVLEGIKRDKDDDGDRDKVILFAHHAEMMQALREQVEACGMDYVFVDGSVVSEEREKQLKWFREERKCQVAVLSMLSCGTGHNLTCASRVFFAELDWTPSNHLQCEDRVHRIGQKNDCCITYLVAEGTSDTIIWPMLDRKMAVTTSILDNTVELAALSASDKNKGPSVSSAGNSQHRGLSAATAAEVQSGRQQTLDRFFVQKKAVASVEEVARDDDVQIVEERPATSPTLLLAQTTCFSSTTIHSRIQEPSFEAPLAASRTISPTIPSIRAAGVDLCRSPSSSASLATAAMAAQPSPLVAITCKNNNNERIESAANSSSAPSSVGLRRTMLVPARSPNIVIAETVGDCGGEEKGSPASRSCSLQSGYPQPVRTTEAAAATLIPSAIRRTQFQPPAADATSVSPPIHQPSVDHNEVSTGASAEAVLVTSSAQRLVGPQRTLFVPAAINGDSRTVVGEKRPRDE